MKKNLWMVIRTAAVAAARSFATGIGSIDTQHMKFCEVKMAKEEGGSMKAGMYATGELISRRLFRHFHLTLRARWKSCPGGLKALERSIHYALRPFRSRISFSTSRRIHAMNVDWS